MSSTTSRVSNDIPSASRVRVWFGAYIVADYVAEPMAAARYADAIRRRFVGLRVTISELADPVDTSAALPSERMWELTP